MDPGRGTPTVYADWDEGLGAFRSLAVLAEKVIRLRPVPGVPWGPFLRGRRLVGNQVLGLSGEGRLDYFFGQMAAALSAGEFDCVLFEDIAVGSSLWTALSRADVGAGFAVVHPAEVQPHWWIDFPERPEEYWGQFSGKARYNFRRMAKKLDPVVTCYRDLGDVPIFLEKASAVSCRSWQGRRIGLRVQNSPREKTFWEFVAAQEAMRSYILEKGGEPVAFVMGIQWNHCYSYEEIGYDHALSESSPGIVLLLRILEDLVAHETPRRFDFGFGDGAYKRLFANRQTSSGPVLAVSRRWRPTAAIWLERSSRGVARAAQAGLRRVGLWSKFRRLYRS
jgi:hypothetical protein